MENIHEDLKKKRIANFTSTERSFLLKITNSFRSVIECKKTDSCTWRDKLETWKKVEEKFNSCTTGAPRNYKQLKNKYEAIKKELKKRHSNHRSYQNGTGGGPYIPPPPSPENEDEKKLAQTIALSIQGFSTMRDSDGLAGITGVPIPSGKELLDTAEDITESIDVDWSRGDAKLLQTEVHPSLKTAEVVITEDTIVERLDTHLENILAKGDHSYTQTRSPKCSPEKSNEWQSRRRPVLPKKKTMTSASAKFEIVAQKKCELISIEMACAEQKRVQTDEEHDAKMKLLELQIEEQKMKNILLRHNVENMRNPNSFV